MAGHGSVAGPEDLSDIDRRAALANDVRALLVQADQVIDVRPYGSLATGRSDRYSDIDLVVEVENLSDRALARRIPEVLAPLGAPLIAGWGLDRLPETYVRTLYLADYPLFWHVDIGCLSPIHEPDPDLATTYHWPQIFKLWIAAVKQLVRGQGEGERFFTHVGRWADLSSLTGSAADRLGQSLDLCVARARRRGAPCEEVYRRCAGLRTAHLRPHGGTVAD